MTDVVSDTKESQTSADAPATAEEEAAIQAEAGGAKLSRGQRRRLLKKQRFLRKMNPTAALKALASRNGKKGIALTPKQEEEKKKREAGLGTLQSLSEMLQTVNEEESRASK